jgi:kumamolisin
VRKHRVVAAVAALALAAGGCSSGGSKHSSTDALPSLSGKTTTLNLGLPAKALNAPQTGAVPGTTVLHVDVVLKVNNAELEKLHNGIKSSASPGSIGKSLGVSDADIARLEQYFAQAHIQVKPSQTQTSVTFDAPASALGMLLKTSFVNHKLKGRTFFTPDPQHMPQVPVEVAGYILAVTGLDSYSPGPTKSGPALGMAPAGLSEGAPGTFCARSNDPQIAVPPKVAQTYGYDRFWQKGWQGQGMTINLVEQDGFVQSDIDYYKRCVGSNVQISVAAQGAAPPVEGETNLDMEMIAGLAPQANVIDYQEDAGSAGTWSALNRELQAIIDANYGRTNTGGVVSISLGAPEDGLTSDVVNSIDQNLKILTYAEHMTVFVSSGDCAAYSDGVLGGAPDVQFPGSDPNVVGVGGTRMQFSGNRVGETVWSSRANPRKCDNSWGSTGGISKLWNRPPFQQGTGVDNRYASGGMREVPDVSAVAINLPMYLQNRWVVAGGTSAAAPIWAAGMALLNQGTMSGKHWFFYSPQALYYVFNHPGANRPLNDVTTGTNLYYPATTGYDLATGMGTPNWPGIYNTLAPVAG